MINLLAIIINSISRCECSHCTVMNTRVQSAVCVMQRNSNTKIDGLEVSIFSCITEHPGN